ncbi:MAG: hypothetical protein AAFQ12_04465, partial [Pseudomonadota bacterium]
MSEALLSRSRVMRLAVPVMLAQAAIAATGVVDTAVMGLYGDKTDLAAVAIASITGTASRITRERERRAS